MSLFINGVEVLRIDDNNNLYVAIEENEYDFMKKVNKIEFLEELKKYSFTCLVSWDKNIKKEYIKIVEYFNNNIY